MITVFLCGDVMTGRGIDQILPHPGDPGLREGYVRSAVRYVELSEALHGQLPRPVGFAWPWGDSLRLMDEVAPAARIINLETSITRSSEFAPGKGVHYRMSPANVATLQIARPDVCVLANNHVLDFGYAGLEETLDTLARTRLRVAGAGRNELLARAPAVVPVASERRVLVFACGDASSGIPGSWAASPDRPGVNLLPGLTDGVAAAMLEQVRSRKQAGDLVIVSIHWGSNWGFDVPAEQRRFAHLLIDGGVDIVHGHSSHHPRPIEVYRGRLVLYGCGDFINDYEGIRGYEHFRDDLRVMYFVSLEPSVGALIEVRMIVMQSCRLGLRRASSADARCLHQVLDHLSRPYAARIDLAPDGWLVARPA